MSDIEDLMDELRSTKNLGGLIPPDMNQKAEEVKLPEIDESNISDYIIKSSVKIIEHTNTIINELKNNLGTADQVAAMAELVNAVNKAVDNINKINIQNKKDKTAKEVKTMDIESRKQLESGKKPSTTNIIVATRNEIMKQLINQVDEIIEKEEKHPVIDIPALEPRSSA